MRSEGHKKLPPYYLLFTPYFFRQWRCAESLPAYSGGTVLDLHQLPRDNCEYSSKQSSFFMKLKKSNTQHSHTGKDTRGIPDCGCLSTSTAHP